MATARITRLARRGLLLSALGLAVGGCSGGSARTDYYASRGIVHPAAAGDGSLIAIGPATGGPWARSLTLVPISDSGDLAADTR